MHIFQVAAKITALGEILITDVTLEGPKHCVLTEVVSQVAALAEDGATSFEFAAKE